MSTRGCCKRGVAAAGWVLPGAALVLLPKCPACLAAYVAVATGFGISFSTAAYLRTSLLVVSVATLAILAGWVGIRWIRAGRERQRSNEL